MTGRPHGADSIAVPVLSRTDQRERPAVVRKLCDGVGSACGGRGVRGVFSNPLDGTSVLCPACMLSVRQCGRM
jgi:hypothetical protein